ncbi:MAG: T9SS type A sorting domain-containing protein [Candidatus Electryonea clarkiae]|nr:T9SS type A sorting domain-containing protein [Candidatus Electryonea clarkiae]MDP8285098.1 T9SS type A sorting domain-containing protein [Candidatus Electryonea clarkiae]
MILNSSGFKSSGIALIAILLFCTISPNLYATRFYVATNGINEPDRGRSVDEPFRTINYALATAENEGGQLPHSINIAQGTYDDEYEIFPLPMIDDVVIRGAGISETIIDAGDQQSNAITSVDASRWRIEKLTITGGVSLQGGGMLILNGEDITIKDVKITGNRAAHPFIPNFEGHGGGVYLYESDNVLLDHVLLTENYALDDGGAISVIRCSPVLYHVTITLNFCENDTASSAIYQETFGADEIVVRNSIVWNNNSSDGIVPTIMADNILASYSLIENDEFEPWDGTGNVWDDPLFTDPESDFTLLQGSAAVDIGDPDSPFHSEPEDNGNRANAGFYGNTPDAQISGANYSLPRDTWAFVGLPVVPESGNPYDLFRSDLGSENTSSATWRFMRWDPEQEIMLRYDEAESGGIEYGDPPDMASGQGYLIRQRVRNRANLTIDGHALSLTEDNIEVALQTHDGISINMIANPFPFPLHWSKSRIRSGMNSWTPDQAAEEGSANLWVYVLDQTKRFMPTLDNLDPWEGALLVTLDDSEMDWWTQPSVRYDGEMDMFPETAWILNAGAEIVDSLQRVIASDNGHLFGIGTQFEYGFDPYDALNIEFLNRQFIFNWTSFDQPSLFHSFQPEDDGEWRYWHAEMIADTTLPDSVIFSVNGLVSDEDFMYPDSGYHFWLEDEDGEVLLENLRDSSWVRLELESFNQDQKRAGVYIIASHSEWDSLSTNVSDKVVQPNQFEITSIYPNPFNSSVTMQYNLPRAGEMTISIFNMLGRKVDNIMMENLSAGTHRAIWNADTHASGVYLLRMEAFDKTAIKRVVLIK